ANANVNVSPGTTWAWIVTQPVEPCDSKPVPASSGASPMKPAFSIADASDVTVNGWPSTKVTLPVYASLVDQPMNMSLNCLPTNSGYSDEKNTASNKNPVTPGGA